MADDPVLKNDIEAGNITRHPVTEKAYTDVRHGSVLDEVARAREIQNSFTPLRYMRRWEEWLDEKLGIETQGIDRIPKRTRGHLPSSIPSYLPLGAPPAMLSLAVKPQIGGLIALYFLAQKIYRRYAAVALVGALALLLFCGSVSQGCVLAERQLDLRRFEQISPQR